MIVLYNRGDFDEKKWRLSTELSGPDYPIAASDVEELVEKALNESGTQLKKAPAGWDQIGAPVGFGTGRVGWRDEL